MPFDCRFRATHGPDVCLTACAATERTFTYARVDRQGDAPPTDPRIVDVALLDMHHGWPNLGHDALVHAIQNQVCDVREALQAREMIVRVLSYDVRRGHAIPEAPGGRHEVYVGTGGPGHLDPAQNDGRSPGSQGIDENGGWEPRLFRLFDAIASDHTASLFGVCHTFGVMCRWLRIADAVLRPPAKGGKSTGIVDNVLTGDAVAHPWFGRFASLLHVRHARQDLVIKPNDEYGGSGVTLGWEAGASAWDDVIARAVGAPAGTWVVQRRIPVRREIFPYVETPHRVVFRDMLVDFAPYLFRGRVAGFLTRLSGTGLANVTSGGGQVPAFVVAPHSAGQE